MRWKLEYGKSAMRGKLNRQFCPTVSETSFQIAKILAFRTFSHLFPMLEKQETLASCTFSPLLA